MNITLYDLRTSNELAGFIEACNRWVHETPGNPYLSKHGEVCSSRWWSHLDADRLPIKSLRGPIIHIGPTTDDFTGEACDLVRFHTNGRDHEYDREGFWLDSRIQPGDVPILTTTKARIKTWRCDET